MKRKYVKGLIFDDWKEAAIPLLGVAAFFIKFFCLFKTSVQSDKVCHTEMLKFR